jgi:hypothetical protein
MLGMVKAGAGREVHYFQLSFLSSFFSAIMARE